MNDISLAPVNDLKSRVTKAGEAVGDRVQSATSVAAAAAGQAQRIGQDTAASIAASAAQAKQVLRDAGDAAQQAWSQASGVAQEFVDADRRAIRSISRLIHENPLLAVLAGVAVGYVAGLWNRRGDGPARIADGKPTARPKAKPRSPHTG
jgi:ElaB/YqjD/DUF883 family membrane-anchored ribosome-binding protein